MTRKPLDFSKSPKMETSVMLDAILVREAAANSKGLGARDFIEQSIRMGLMREFGSSMYRHAVDLIEKSGAKIDFRSPEQRAKEVTTHAAQERLKSENDLAEHQDGAQGGQATKAGGRDCDADSRQGEEAP